MIENLIGTQLEQLYSETDFKMINGKILETGAVLKPGQASLLFFYPKDFTFVCPTELIALNNRMNEFNLRQINVFGISNDNIETHQKWTETPLNEGGVGQLKYPLVADDLGIFDEMKLVEQFTEPEVYPRASLLIDKNGILQSYMVNNLPIGRNIDEILRLFDAIDFYSTNGDVCPANWAKGKAPLEATEAGIKEYLEKYLFDLR